MKKIFFTLMCALMVLSANAQDLNSKGDNIIGEYLSLKDGSKSKIRITKEDDGTYKAQVINAYIDLQDDIDGDYDGNKKRGNMLLTVNDTKLPVMLDEGGELFYTSRTKLTNTKVKYNPGTIEIDKPGKYRILLERAEDGENIPFEMLQFERTL